MDFRMLDRTYYPYEPAALFSHCTYLPRPELMEARVYNVRAKAQVSGSLHLPPPPPPPFCLPCEEVEYLKKRIEFLEEEEKQQADFRAEQQKKQDELKELEQQQKEACSQLQEAYKQKLSRKLEETQAAFNALTEQKLSEIRALTEKRKAEAQKHIQASMTNELSHRAPCPLACWCRRCSYVACGGSGCVVGGCSPHLPADVSSCSHAVAKRT
eukprot:gnl/Spiro4/4064_TR2021_c0_g1_i1.p1 gnl/Spiro4/4064_TR2021_c0_g1~~gnl/Spiro4/4064_TR2021_c0_g1_i1.p1  ORF type:complete len:225 (+),score=45.37 gnl/Spiro4/4064_TR2021_c0_g1_i1:39-677(+)